MAPASILIVEDDPALVHAICRNLSVRGYITESAGDVATALSVLDQSCPALLLLDIDLPDGSGWDVLRALRRGDCRSTQVIVISALQPNPRLIKELQCGAFLEKPFPMESLLRLVQKYAERDGGSGGNGTGNLQKTEKFSDTAGTDAQAGRKTAG